MRHTIPAFLLALVALNSCSSTTEVAPVTRGNLNVTSSIDLGEIPFGTCTEKSIPISNTGSAAVTIQSIKSPQHELKARSLPLTLTAGTTDTLFSTACPTAIGAQSYTDSLITSDSTIVLHQNYRGLQYMASSAPAFTYDVHEENLDGTLVPGSAHMATAVVTDRNATVAGEAQVTVLADDSERIQMKPLADGDVMIFREAIPIYQEVELPEMWRTFAFATKAKDTVIYDEKQVVDFGGGVSGYFSMKITIGFVSDSVVTIDGMTMHTSTVREVTLVRVTVNGQLNTTTVTRDRTYAHELGYMVAEVTTSDSDSDQSPVPNGRSIKMLKSIAR